MQQFTVRDLREYTGALIRGAEQGELAMVTKHGRPVFIAVPFDETMIRWGLNTAMAIYLFQQKQVSLGQAAKISADPMEVFLERLGVLGINAVDYSPKEIKQELEYLRDIGGNASE